MKQQGGKLFRYAFFLLITLAPGGQTGNLLRSLLTTKNGCLIFLFGFSFPKRYILQLLLRMGQVANSRIQLNIQFTRLQQLLLKRFEMSFGLLLFLLKGLFPKEKMSMIIKAAVPYLCADFVAMMIIFFFPAVALWLPSVVK